MAVAAKVAVKRPLKRKAVGAAMPVVPELNSAVEEAARWARLRWCASRVGAIRVADVWISRTYDVARVRPLNRVGIDGTGSRGPHDATSLREIVAEARRRIVSGEA